MFRMALIVLLAAMAGYAQTGSLREQIRELYRELDPQQRGQVLYQARLFCPELKPSYPPELRALIERG